MTNDTELKQRLERFLAARIESAEPPRVVELERSTEGFSQETFSFAVEIPGADGPVRRHYVAKREPVAGLLEPYDLEPEFRVLHALSEEPLLSPATPWFERDPAVLERPFYVMERLPGSVPIPASRLDGTAPFDEAEGAALGPQVALELARLHAVDWKALELGFLGAPEPGRAAAERETERWAQRIEKSGITPPPVVSEALLWLRTHLPETSETTLVHGDYRLGNFLVERDGAGSRLTGVLDWEMVHLGDPLEDLAWCTSPIWSAGTGMAGAMIPTDRFALAYARESGRPLDLARLQFYGVLSVVKMLAIMLTGIRAFCDGRTRDLRMAVFDHQQRGLCALLAVLRGWLSPEALQP